MLEISMIAEIAKTVVRTWAADAHLERVLSEPTTDSEGNDALRITLVLKPEQVRLLTGDQALDILVGIQQRLEAAGEERFPIVGYATEQELLDDVGEDADLDEDEG